MEAGAGAGASALPSRPAPTFESQEDRDALVAALVPFRRAQPVKYQRVLARVRALTQATAPAFGAIVDVAAVPLIPEVEKAAFKAKHVSNEYLHGCVWFQRVS
jgi:hypothetical protein